MFKYLQDIPCHKKSYSVGCNLTLTLHFVMQPYPDTSFTEGHADVSRKRYYQISAGLRRALNCDVFVLYRLAETCKRLRFYTLSLS